MIETLSIRDRDYRDHSSGLGVITPSLTRHITALKSCQSVLPYKIKPLAMKEIVSLADWV